MIPRGAVRIHGSMIRHADMAGRAAHRITYPSRRLTTFAEFGTCPVCGITVVRNAGRWWEHDLRPIPAPPITERLLNL